MNRRHDKHPFASATEAVRSDRRSLFLAALLFVGTLSVYWQVRGFEFLSVDDSAYVTQNRPVLEGITLQNLKWSFTTVHDSNWIPFTWLSLMLDTQLYGPIPGGYHLTNALLHAVSTVLLFAALAQATQMSSRSAFVAALFALHPLHVESVAWIAERKDVLSIFFGLLSLLAYVGYVLRRGWPLFAASVLFFVCSLLSKQTLVTLPFVYLLLDY